LNWADNLFSAQEKSHTLVKMDGAPNHNADVENLVAASKLVEDSGKESFWEPQDVQKAASDVEATASEPGGCRR
jgi:hypothetical protein